MALTNLMSTAKGIARAAMSLSYYISGQQKRASLGAFTILMYHRVVPDNDPYIPYIQPGMYVRVSSFKKQLEFLVANYELVSIGEMLRLIETKQVSIDKQYCVITFDDGWLDNYQYAFPVLKQFSAPATIFLAESFIGNNRFFWHEKISKLFYLVHTGLRDKLSVRNIHGVKDGSALDILRDRILSNKHDTATVDATIEALKSFTVEVIEDAVDTLAQELGISFDAERTMLNWEEVAEMGQNNITFGSHTCKHQILTNLSAQEAALEIRGSFEKLKSRKLNFVPIFCYPNGRYNDEIKSIVTNAGYSAAVTTKLGRESGRLADPFAIMRIGIHDDIAYNKAVFAYRLR